MLNDEKKKASPWHVDAGFYHLPIDERDRMDREFTEIKNTLHLSRNETACAIYQKGIEALLEELSQSESGLSPTGRMCKMMNEKRRERENNELILSFYKEYGYEKTVECGIENLDAILAKSTISDPPSNLKWTDRADLFISHYLDEHGPSPAKDVIESAVENNIIDSNPIGRERLHKIAQRRGFVSGQHGLWAKLE